jgi:hypothetical protein
MAKLDNKQMKKRDLMLIGLLVNNPHLTHEEAITASRDKFGCGISFEKFKAIKSEAKKGPPDAEVKEALHSAHDEVRKALKKGTRPLKAKIKELGKTLVENGIDEAVMKVIDGVPHWHIVEKRSYDIS